MEKLRLGEEVIWRGCWGIDLPKLAKVTQIEINDINTDSLDWDKIKGRNVVIHLDNSHWAYGFQISKNNLNNIVVY